MGLIGFVQSQDYAAPFSPPFPPLATFPRGLSRKSSGILQARRPGVGLAQYRLTKASASMVLPRNG
jgi:hypothetical protein